MHVALSYELWCMVVRVPSGASLAGEYMVCASESIWRVHQRVYGVCTAYLFAVHKLVVDVGS